MSPTLKNKHVQQVLDHLHSLGEQEDAENALVIADLSLGDPHHVRYRDHVNDPRHGYMSIEIPIDAGVLVSRRQSRKSPAPLGIR
jgi:hypothetical protein